MGLSVNKVAVNNAVANTQNVDAKKNVLLNAKTKAVGNDSFKPSKLDIDSTMAAFEKLTVAKDNKKVAKFDAEDISYLKHEIEEETEKSKVLYSLASKEHITKYTLKQLAKHSYDTLKEIDFYAGVKNAKGKPAYSNHDLLVVFADGMLPEDLNEARPLTKTALSAENIAFISQAKNEGATLKNHKVVYLDQPIEKIANKISEVEAMVKDATVEKTLFTLNPFEKFSYKVAVTDSNNVRTNALLNHQMQVDAVEKVDNYTTAEGKSFQIKKVNDYRNNTTSKVRAEINPEYQRGVVTHEVRLVKDKDGNPVRTEYTEPSDVTGIYNIKHMMPNGEVKVISSAKVDDKTGITTVKKDMTSIDGTRTQYLYEDDPQGNRLMDYKITDKDGNVLLDNSKTFEVVSPTKFISSKNKDYYEINLTDKGLTVQDMNNKDRNATFTIGKELQGNTEKLLTSLKQMSGEDLLKLAKSTSSVIGIDDVLGSYFKPSTKEINSGDNLFVILHELGHARDSRDVSTGRAYYQTVKNAINQNPELNKTYNEERDAFNKAFPDAQREHISYFINYLTHYNGETGGLQETIAESNALLTTPRSVDLLAIRTQYLQQYFPRTIALLDGVLNK